MSQALGDNRSILNQKMLSFSILSGLSLILFLVFAMYQTGQKTALAIELSYAIVVGLGWLALRFKLLDLNKSLYIQVLAIMIFPVLSAYELGGMFSSGGRALWCLFGPIALLVFHPGLLANLSMLGQGVLTFSLLYWDYKGLAISEQKLSIEWILSLGAIHSGGVGVFVYLLVREHVLRLKYEQDKTEGLLLNMLPESIAVMLRDDPKKVVAHREEEVGILFADIVGFSKLAQKCAPEEVVSLLNELFSQFDFLAEKYNVEKIKTIGDSYMAASGVPFHSDDHVKNLCSLALDMQEFVKNNEVMGHRIELRIGLHVGGLVAGVIGKRKFIYDLWGHTVNIASRAEHASDVGEVWVTESILAKSGSENFDFEPKGEFDLKGVGLYSLWSLGRPG
ncbi:adenylate/guanylate cyclase domain-containing protein [bacterium]|nr:adenylate/guanylate cyclase domain-containing protein [bacterium]